MFKLLPNLLKKYDIEYFYNEHYPDEIKMLDLSDIYYAPTIRTIFDDKNRVEYNKRKELELFGFKILSSNNKEEIINFIEKNGFSNNLI